MVCGERIVWVMRPGGRRGGEDHPGHRAISAAEPGRQGRAQAWKGDGRRADPHPRERICEARIDELAAAITADYAGTRPVLVCVLKGAVLFVADLVRRLPFDLEIEFMAVSSYGKSTESSGVVRILKDLETDIEGRHVLDRRGRDRLGSRRSSTSSAQPEGS